MLTHFKSDCGAVSKTTKKAQQLPADLRTKTIIQGHIVTNQLLDSY